MITAEIVGNVNSIMMLPYTHWYKDILINIANCVKTNVHKLIII